MKKIKIHTDKMFYDITSQIKPVKDGLILVYSPHTTTSVKVMENESRLLKDIERWIEKKAPRWEHYDHDDIEHRPVPAHERMNAYSHLRSFYGSTSEIIPVVNGELALGKWQKVMFIEYDIGRDREIHIYEIT